MSSNYGALKSDLQFFAEQLRAMAGGSLVLLHHNDTDGLSSGTILLTAFKRLNIAVKCIALEKPYPDVVKTIFKTKEPGEMVVMSDFGSGMLGLLSEINADNSPVLVVDHHSISKYVSSNIFLLNCLNYGLSGKQEASASSLAYVFANELSPDNGDLIDLGLLGAYGDGQWGEKVEPQGINAKMLRNAEHTGAVFLSPSGWVSRRLKFRFSEVSDYLNTMGSYGYYQKGPKRAVEVLEKRQLNSENLSLAKQLSRDFEKRRKTFFESTSRIHKEAHLEWFDLGKEFFGFGVKSVGLICERLIAEDAIDQNKYLLGFQDVQSRIPGIGDMVDDLTKVSMRIPNGVADRISSFGWPDLLKVLVPATQSLGGFVDACHPHAAAVAIKQTKKQELIQVINAILKDLLR